MGARIYVFYLIVAGLVSLMLSAIASPVMAAKPTSQSKLTALDLQGQPMMDDFDRMLERRGVRVLVPYSRTLFFAVGDIHLAEPNVHGGIKYMRHLIDYYFRDANFDEQNRTLFAFASYNAGPGRIAKLRREAQLRGLDPDTWFNNVEIVAARRIGQETVQYVRNIYKYYIAYRLQLDTLEMRKAAGEQFR